ncbi:hypothetical protein [Nodularia sphaerocarpa]|uniref:hypothetical protein n=1 Tax=Nodularia sphaerocarpa TaxID=137816 RepID=UPI001EFA6F3F|nr:hypothetical protein [Nodularia sphaerocarpa]MDB9374686.1 hypothetical protein [Nodularia sphaerocarpa CS-585]MDB9378856.1 hypothetical protein [Nodularia sphaerocarpa CS-585A2]ULP73094.1 hypothetical protein BDGGKGIB_02747 [Nodularia sphaerocarpa UHCC 0038]
MPSNFINLGDIIINVNLITHIRKVMDGVLYITFIGGDEAGDNFLRLEGEQAKFFYNCIVDSIYLSK